VSIETRPGEVWAVDFGLAAKQRPVLILAYPQPENARALVVVAPLTSQLRGLGEKWTLANPVGFPSAPQ
jgi:mRNA-degrading endonuclease toxin of MazEF toxin-antitoxin module